MDRKDLILAALSVAGNQEHTPVQIQKMFFLIDENLSDLIGGRHFNFEPYNYGPFDKEVYKELENLANEGLVQIIRKQTWNSYTLTPLGIERGQELLKTFSPEVSNYIWRVSEFVRKLSFTELVSSIYKAYPRMRENSVFQG